MELSPMKRNAVVLLSLSLAWSIAHADAPASPIAYKAPDTWTLLKSNDQRGVHLVLYEIKDDRGSLVPSNALIISYKLPVGRDMTEADQIIAARMQSAKATPINFASDGSNWKTYLYTGKEGNTDMIYLDRIGMTDGFAAEEVFSFPLVPSDGKDYKVLTLASGLNQGVYCVGSSVKPMVDQFNAFSSTIAGTNSFDGKAVLIDPPPDGQAYRRTDSTR